MILLYYKDNLINKWKGEGFYVLWTFSQGPLDLGERESKHHYEAWIRVNDIERLEEAKMQEWQYEYLTREDIKMRNVQSYVQTVEVVHAADDE